MHRRLRLGWRKPAAIAFLLALALAAPAGARKLQMSGTWLVRKGQAFIPLQFNIQGALTHVSMGSWTEAPFFPTGTPMGGMSALARVVRDVGGVTATGSNPATLVIPKHRWAGDHLAIIPGQVHIVVQITTMLQIDAPYDSASFMAGGGPGSFTWCPANPACTVGGAIPGGQPAADNGRVVYAAGANQFGGTMQMGLRGGGSFSRALDFTPFVVGHAIILGSGPTLRKLAVGGGANDAPTIQRVYLPRGYATNPTMVPFGTDLIRYPGPFVTTMFGNTLTMPTGVKFKLPAVTPLMTMTAVYTTNEAFPHTTGTVLAQQVTGTGGDDFFSVMGSDARTPLGAGNLNSVAGGLARRTQLGKAGLVRTRHAQFDKVFLSLGPPVPSLSPAGLAAAAVLMLLTAGYAGRRRRWQPYGG